LPPLQLTLLETEAVPVAAVGDVMVIDAVPVHPLLSVTVTVYVPANNEVIGLEVAALLHK